MSGSLEFKKRPKRPNVISLDLNGDSSLVDLKIDVEILFYMTDSWPPQFRIALGLQKGVGLDHDHYPPLARGRLSRIQP